MSVPITGQSDLDPLRKSLQTFQSRKSLLNGDVNLALLHGRTQIRVTQRTGVLFASAFGESEHDDWKEILLLQIANEMDVEIAILLLVKRSRWRTATSTRGSSPTLSTAGWWRSTPCRSSGSGTASTYSLNGREAGCLSLFVLPATKRLPCFLVPATRQCSETSRIYHAHPWDKNWPLESTILCISRPAYR